MNSLQDSIKDLKTKEDLLNDRLSYVAKIEQFSKGEQHYLKDVTIKASKEAIAFIDERLNKQFYWDENSEYRRYIIESRLKREKVQ